MPIKLSSAAMEITKHGDHWSAGVRVILFILCASAGDRHLSRLSPQQKVGPGNSRLVQEGSSPTSVIVKWIYGAGPSNSALPFGQVQERDAVPFNSNSFQKHLNSCRKLVAVMVRSSLFNQGKITLVIINNPLPELNCNHTAFYTEKQLGLVKSVTANQYTRNQFNF